MPNRYLTPFLFPHHLSGADLRTLGQAAYHVLVDSLGDLLEGAQYPSPSQGTGVFLNGGPSRQQLEAARKPTDALHRFAEQATGVPHQCEDIQSGKTALTLFGTTYGVITGGLGLGGGLLANTPGALEDVVDPLIDAQKAFKRRGAGGTIDAPKKLTQAQEAAVRKINNIEKGHLKPHDYTGTIRDMTGNPVPKPGGGYWDHAQEMANSLRGLRKHAKSLEGATDPAGIAAREKALGLIKGIEDLIKGAGQ